MSGAGMVPAGTVRARSAPSATIAVGLDTARIRGVLFDLDGTLYGQSIVRTLIALELLAVPLLRGPWCAARTTWRTLAEFRRVREEIRDTALAHDVLEELQYVETARRTGVCRSEVERCVREWIFQRPLKYLRYGRRAGILRLLAFLEANRIQAGILSDYPAADKIRALGLGGRFSVLICATDSEVNAFKPRPAGFLRACQLWGLPPHQVLYVGDRPDVDAAGAAAAGMPCAIVSPAGWLGRRPDPGTHYLTVPYLWRLQRVLDRP